MRAAGIDAPVMVMRGDGGATDLAGFRGAPARTLYSGPAASVAGRAAVRGRHRRGRRRGRRHVHQRRRRDATAARRSPTCTVASHATALRAVDVRVVGVAGGSMLRVRRGTGRTASARAARTSPACRTPASSMRRASMEGVSSSDRAASGRPGRPPRARLADGTRCAITMTCAANALAITDPATTAGQTPLRRRSHSTFAGRRLRSVG